MAGATGGDREAAADCTLRAWRMKRNQPGTARESNEREPRQKGPESQAKKECQKGEGSAEPIGTKIEKDDVWDLTIGCGDRR